MLADRTNSFATGLLHFYLQVKMRRHFHKVEVSGVPGFEAILKTSAQKPLVFFGNHRGWWDGFFIFELGRRYGLSMRVIMEERNLRRYPFFRYTGAFGVDLDKEHSRSQALLHAARFLRDDSLGPRAFIIYPQGRLVSPLEKEWPPFKPGLETLLRLCPQALAIPIVHEIIPGPHPKPEVTIEVGRPLVASTTPSLSDLEQALKATQEAMITKALGQASPDSFHL